MTMYILVRAYLYLFLYLCACLHVYKYYVRFAFFVWVFFDTVICLFLVMRSYHLHILITICLDVYICALFSCLQVSKLSNYRIRVYMYFMCKIYHIRIVYIYTHYICVCVSLLIYSLPIQFIFSYPRLYFS